MEINESIWLCLFQEKVLIATSDLFYLSNRLGEGDQWAFGDVGLEVKVANDTKHGQKGPAIGQLIFCKDWVNIAGYTNKFHSSVNQWPKLYCSRNYRRRGARCFSSNAQALALYFRVIVMV